MLGEVDGLRFAHYRLTLSSGHATSPAQGSGRGNWDANSLRLLQGPTGLGYAETCMFVNSRRYEHAKCSCLIWIVEGISCGSWDWILVRRRLAWR